MDIPSTVIRSAMSSNVWDEPYATRIVWLTMLFASEADGSVRMARGALARRAGVSDADCVSALLFLGGNGPSVSSDPYIEDRIDGGWVINNAIHDAILVDSGRTKAAVRQRRHRAKVRAAQQ